jgi:hypothetical protein
MNSYYHAVISAKKHGGVPEDYQPLHDFIDSSKQTIADIRHRAILHSAFGIFIAEKVFGPTIKNSEGKEVPTRIIAEEHVQDDLGFIPTVEHWLGEMPARPWMSGSRKKNRQEPEPPKLIPLTEEQIKDLHTPKEEISRELTMDGALQYREKLRNLGKIKNDKDN